jgi:hypothetical protein
MHYYKHQKSFRVWPSHYLHRLDLAMSILETFGNIAYGLKNRFDRTYLDLFSKRRVFRGHDHTIQEFRLTPPALFIWMRVTPLRVNRPSMQDNSYNQATGKLSNTFVLPAWQANIVATSRAHKLVSWQPTTATAENSYTFVFKRKHTLLNF